MAHVFVSYTGADVAWAEVVALTQSLAGPGGVGKTVLAVEYTWRY
ncbi:MAG: hypothetical protein ACRDYA_04255 [Egibacteraceae bacterium]